jgi:hypothetical protein
MPTVKMMKFRLFTNDRGSPKGVPLYSCLKEVMASSPAQARRQVPKQFDAPNFAPSMAIRWPESEQSESEKAWLKRHVGPDI